MSEWGSGYDSDAPDPWDPLDDILFFDDNPRSRSLSSPQSESPVASLERENFAQEQPAKKLLPLQELCCRFIGQNVPFGIVQLYPSPIPEHLLQRIAFWTFPTDKKKLLNKAVLSGVSEHEIQSAKASNVENMLQSGEIA